MTTTTEGTTMTDKTVTPRSLARRIDDDHLACRLVGHSWWPATPQRTPSFGVLLTWECRRCEAVREDIVQPRTGDLLARRYEYAPGYALRRPEGAQRGGRLVPAAALRAEMIRRQRS